MPISLHFDNIIYKLQKLGGVSVYWNEMTSRINQNKQFNVRFTEGNKFSRILPVGSESEIFHSSHFRITPSRKTKIVSSIHDLIYEKSLAKSSLLGTTLNIWERRQAIEKADTIICVSENTKREMLEIYPFAASKIIEVVYVACSFNRDTIIQPTITDRIFSLSKSDKNFALYVGTRKTYKNFNSALIGFAESELRKNNFLLVCTGVNFDEQEQSLINKLDLQNSVLMLDYATQVEMSYLYQNAFALLYTSTYEGFGMPPLEAMSSGSPVIAANISSMPEVIGDAGILLDDITDYSLVSSSLNQLLNEQVRSEYIQKGIEQSKKFTWDRCADRHMEIYKNLVGKN
jgi:glycosyltransferase involved in cell wall biosynthesis